ncbi:MAG: zf-TFIIB domain-containing protein [Candidatus Brocadiia bacterium]
MRCPRCNETLRAVRYEGVPVETCPACEGEWLDAEELGKVVHTVEETFTPEQVTALDAINESVFSLDDSPPNQLHCPKCPGVELNRFNYASSSGIALDKCPGCGGIWLDKDELEHVQILVEEWEKKLDEDREKYGPALEKARQRVHQELDQGASVSRFGFVNAILRGFWRRLG